MGVLGSANLSVPPNPSQAELFLPFKNFFSLCHSIPPVALGEQFVEKVPMIGSGEMWISSATS
jgi:hypothetical protein